jgi:hypothetical protein
MKALQFLECFKGISQLSNAMLPYEAPFDFDCQIKICRTPEYAFLEMCGTHDAESHSPEKESGRHFKIPESRTDCGHLHWRTQLRIAPKQSAKHFHSILENSSPEESIDSALAECAIQANTRPLLPYAAQRGEPIMKIT